MIDTPEVSKLNRRKVVFFFFLISSILLDFCISRQQIMEPTKKYFRHSVDLGQQPEGQDSAADSFLLAICRLYIARNSEQLSFLAGLPKLPRQPEQKKQQKSRSSSSEWPPCRQKEGQDAIIWCSCGLYSATMGYCTACCMAVRI